MQNSDIAALIERVEKTECGSRDLDAQIEQALFFPDTRVAGPTDFANRGEPHAPGYIVGRPYFIKAEPYTASIDAAVALIERVLPGAFWKIDSFGIAFVAPPGRSPSPQQGATPALALILATLRALQSQEPR